MDLKKLSSGIIAMMLVSIGFSMIISDNASAAFILPLSNNGMSNTFVATDTTWNDAGTMAVVVGHDTNPSRTNAYVYYFLNDTYVPINNGGFNQQNLYSVDHYAEAIYGWSNGSRSSDDASASMNSITPPTITQQPMPDDEILRRTLVYQDFSSATFPPTGWGTQTSGTTGAWSRGLTNWAGGVSPEATFTYGSSGQGTSRLYVGPMNTAGMSNFKLQWRHYLNDYTGVGAKLIIQTSSDGAAWNDAGWYWDDTQSPGAIAATLNSMDIVTADVGSSTFYVAWVVTGNSYQINNWYVDNVLLSGSWFDNMESGIGSWVPTDNGMGTRWQLGNPAGFGPGVSYSGASCWGTNLVANYGNSADVSLAFPTIDTTGQTSAFLTFRMWFNSELTNDAGWVEAFNGVTWVAVNPVLGPAYQATIYGTPGYTGAIGGWLLAKFDVSAYAGGLMYLRFHFRSNAVLPVAAGWYIDDVTISANYAVGMTPEFQNKYGFPNQFIDHPLTVLNQGFNADTYSLSASGNAWPVSLISESDSAININSHSTTYTGTYTRGLWFTAPCDFIITGLRVPTDVVGVQNIEVMRFNTPIPLYASTTNDFVSLGRWINVAGTSFITCSIPVYTNDIIGILGARGPSGSLQNSYSGVYPFSTTINGFSVPLERIGMQFDLNAESAHDIWRNTVAHGRVEMLYSLPFNSVSVSASGSANFRARVSIPGGASPNNYDVATVTAISMGVPSVTASAQVRTKVPGGILSTTPANGATGVAITQSVQVTFGEPMVTATVTYTCSPDPGGWVASWNTPTNTILTLTHTAFTYDTLHTFQITAGTDIYGNPLGASVAPNPWTFTTVGATATATGPIGGPTNVAGITITYAWTDTPTSVRIYYTTNGGTTWNLWGSDLSVDGSYALTLINPGTYGWIVQAVGGGSVEPSPPPGGTVPESASYIFDNSSPTITATNPASAATGIAIAQSIVITFSEAMNTGTIAYNCAPDPGGWTPSWNGPVNTILTLIHNPFAYGTPYTVTVTAGTDVAGNALAAGAVPNPWTFTTITGASATATGPISATPTNVAAITMTYTWSGDTPTSVNLYYTTNSGTSWTLAGNDATVDGSFAWTVPAVSGTYGWIAQAVGGGSTEISPPAGGTVPEATPYLFDNLRPTVAWQNPINGAIGVALTQSIMIRFSESMNVASFTYTCSPDPLGWGVVWSTTVFTNDRVTLTHNAFAYGTTYTFTITAVTDVAGNTLNPTPYAYSFTTVAQASATATGPTGGPTNVVGVTIAYTYTGAPTSVNLYYTKSTIAPWAWVLAGNDATVDGSYAYTIVAGAGTYRWYASAVGGGSTEPSPPTNVMAPESGSYILDLAAPTITVTNPVNGATGVATTQSIVITFSEAMNTGTVTYTCSPDPTGWTPSWNGPTNTILTLTHTAFAYGTLHTFTVTAGIDVAGNALLAGAVPNPWTFTTIAAASATATGPISATATNVAAITVTYTYTGAPTSVRIYYTTTGGTSWILWGSDLTIDGSYTLNLITSGTYGWIAQAVGGGSLEIIPPLGGTAPEATPYIFDNIGPTITVTSPVNAATGVAANANVVITFSEAMNTASLTYTCVPNPGGWAVVWSGGNTIATLTHTNFAFFTLHTFTVTAALDAAGNSLVAGAVPNPWTFTTGATALAIGPTGGPTNVAAITISYSYTGAPTSVNLYYSTNGGTSWTLAGNDATVDGSFAWTVPVSGSYRWLASAVGGGSTEPSPPPGGTIPETTLSYIVDLIAPAPPTGLSVDWYGTIYSENFEGDGTPTFAELGWVTGGASNDWQIGTPSGLGIPPDPIGAYGGSFSIGNDLTGLGLYPGEYEDGITIDSNYIYSPTIDCTGYTDVTLRFMRYLQIESATYDHAYIEVATNPAGPWTQVWSHTGVTFMDASWREVFYDISSVADNQPAVFIRFELGATDGSVVYCGWNIDDLMVLGWNPSGGTEHNTLKWTLSSDDGAGANDVSSYNIYRAATSAGPWNAGAIIATVPAGTTFYFDMNRGQPDGINWWYVVRAVDTAGNQELNIAAVPEDATIPTITATNPANGATGVAITAPVVVTFSEAMNPASVTYTCVPAVIGWSVVWSGGNTIATYSHTGNFAYNTPYTFTITAGTDITGNALVAGAVPNPWTFTTVVRATATATGPISAGTNVVAVTLTYNWADTPTSVNLYYTMNGGTTWTFAGNDATVDGSYAYTIVSGSGTYGWYASAVGGGSLEPSPPAGGTLPEASSYVLDATRPTITVTNPASAATGVAIAQNVVITFSEAINTVTFAYNIVPNPGGLGVVWSGGNTIATISHTAFAYGTPYTVTVTVASDIYGNLLNAGAVPNPWTFTTIAAASATATGPISAGTSVTAISMTYTYTGAPTSVNLYYTTNGGTSWTLAGNDVTVDGSYAYTIVSGSGSYGWYASAVGGGSAEPSPPAGGTPSEASAYILDVTRPTITVTNPASAATGVAITQNVVITFSEAINTVTFAYNIVPNPGGLGVVWSGGNTIATISHTAFAYGTPYTVTVTVASDVYGNLLNAGAVPNPWTFTTIAAATATATGPTGGPTNVAGITIAYTYTGIPTSVNLYYTTNGGTTWILAGNDASVDGSFAWTVPASGTYGWRACAVGGGSAEVSPPTGGTTPEAASYIFDNVRPTISITVPVSAATGVAITENIVITFSEAINTGTFNYNVVPNPGGLMVAWSGGFTIATITHTAFAYGTTYTVTVTVASDSAGNLLNAGAVPNPWSFTTVFGATATATGPTGGPTNVASINLAYSWTGTPTSVNLYYTTTGGTTWFFAGNDVSVNGNYAWVILGSGTYGWYASAVGGGSTEPSPPAGGTAPESSSYIFDNTSPTITVTNPASGATGVLITQNIVITFSEAMNPGSFGYNCVPITLGWSVGWSGGNTIVTLSHGSFAYDTPYTFTVTAANDVAGNSLFAGAAPNPWTFTTISAATATATSPSGGPTNVASIAITYTWTGTPTSVNLYYTTNGGSTWNFFANDDPVDGSYVWFIPATGYYSWYASAVGGGSTEPSPPAIGTSPEAGPYIYDNQPPSITSVSPAPGAINVMGNSPIIITFSEPMFIGLGTFIITPNPGGIVTSWSNGDRTLTITHFDFPEDTFVTVDTDFFYDPAGNLMNPTPYSWSFTTSAMVIVGYNDIFWICGDKIGGPPATVYTFEPHSGNTLIPMNNGAIDPEFHALALDNLGNPLCAGSALSDMYYFDGTQWIAVPDDIGALSGYSFESIDFNPNDGRFYVGALFNIFYTDSVPLNFASECHMFNNYFGNGDDITSIAWNELYDYGLIAEGPEIIKIWPYGYFADGSIRYQAVPGSTITHWYKDLSWDTDGWNEVGIVGAKGGNRAYWRYYHSNPRLIEGYVGGAGNYLACAMKPPASPKWLFIPYNDGSIKVQIMEKDESDRVIFSVEKPNIFALDMWKQSDPIKLSVLGNPAEANTTYTFFIEGNYTRGGWDYWDPANLQMDLSAWYDCGEVGTNSVPGDPTWISDSHRTGQFRLIYTPGSLPVMDYPFGSPNEFSVDSYHDSTGYGLDGSIHRLYINITFGPQTLFSPGNLALPPASPWHPNTALNDLDTWDLNVTLQDTIESTAWNSTYSEFGIQKYASISSWGSPSGSIPPGSFSMPLDSPSYIRYSINAPYTLNVSIPNLYKNGNPLMNFIPSGNVEVINPHPNSDPGNSDMDSWAPFTIPNDNLCIWGQVSGSYTVPAPENGIISAGPDYTDYTNPIFQVTSIEWAVTVIVGTPEGTYRGTITITLWSG